MDEAWTRWDRQRDSRPEPSLDDASGWQQRRPRSPREPDAGSLRDRVEGWQSRLEGRLPSGRGGPEPLEQRLDRWVTRGRELVDGVAGARPGSRSTGPEGSGLAHRGLGAGGLNPGRLGRWVEERLDQLLDDDGDDDWREPWQEPAGGVGRRPIRGEDGAHGSDLSRLQPPTDPWGDPARASVSAGRRRDEPPLRSAASDAVPARSSPAAVPARRSLEAISRRPAPADSAGVPPLPLAAGPAAARAPLASSQGQSTTPQGLPNRASPGESVAAAADPESWPDDASFTLPRWQRPLRAAGSAGPPNGSAAPSSGPVGRPLPRSTRRR